MYIIFYNRIRTKLLNLYLLFSLYKRLKYICQISLSAGMQANLVSCCVIRAVLANDQCKICVT